jgi:hypothetical protein
VDVSLLFCLPRIVPYYERLGWRPIEQPIQIDQSSGRIEAPIPVMVYPAEGGALLETLVCAAESALVMLMSSNFDLQPVETDGVLSRRG